MKKVLSLFSVFTLLYTFSPANAAPPPPPGGGGQVIKAGPGYRYAPRRRHFAPPPRGIGFIGRYYPYRTCFGFGGCYTPCYPGGVYVNIGVPIRF